MIMENANSGLNIIFRNSSIFNLTHLLLWYNCCQERNLLVVFSLGLCSMRQTKVLSLQNSEWFGLLQQKYQVTRGNTPDARTVEWVGLCINIVSKGNFQ